MNLTKEQEAKFKKLSISTCLDLALIVPSGYEDLRLTRELHYGDMQVIDATIEAVFRAKSSLQVTMFAHNFEQTITAIFFNPKPYMLHQFKVGERDFYYGQVEKNGVFTNMLMPKKISEIGAISPKYKTVLRNDVMKRLISSVLTKHSLLDEGLREDIADELLEIHFPKELKSQKEFSQKTMQAIKYGELFSYMKRLSSKRRYFPSISNSCQDYTKWAEGLPFKLTQEQRLAIEDIKMDLQKSVSAKRMIVGDVGCGKTMVILASALMSLPNRSILMAPTTILASQLYEEATKFLPSIKTVLVTNKNKKKPLDEYDFIIGTHALLYRELPLVSLVMIDEQHRFGTQQRSLLEKLANQDEKKPHFLQFSATPIPRTLSMIQTSYIDVSLITTTPFEKNIKTKVIHKADFKELLEHIKNEISKNNQVLLVYPLVQESQAIEYQSINEARSYWERHFKNVFVTHGGDSEKEEILLEFSKNGDILIATTVVEVGISLPKLSSVVIVGAERLGLSTLHQLRGRVSRTGLQGYCFLYTNQKESKRLELFCKTTNGFDIANLDLTFRKSGDLIKGDTQSGSQFKWVDLAEDEEIIKSVKMDMARA